ncbi:MAG: DUF2461 domain-containing protein [Bacteroidota bacterium]|nr:DUF2461 domain-containing protein [Bacteroidota bacterium]
MKDIAINKSTLKFLKDLAANNNREWFNAHKDIYIQSQQNMTDVVDRLIFEMNKHDAIENESGKKSLYRIYNDVRFSKDKSPYNARFAFSLRRATTQKRGGYYINIKPGNSYIACGFFSPNPEDLKRIRLDIEANYSDWNKLLKSKNIKANFGNLRGDAVATTPKGFDINHPAIGLLRYKQFILRHDLTDKEVAAESFIEDMNRILKSVRPFFNYMSDVLTTDLNGESII